MNRIVITSLFCGVILSLLVQERPALAQGWTDDGTVVRLTTSTDNVGIGTTAPATKLDVLGTASALRFSTGSGSSLFGHLAGNQTTALDNSFFGSYSGYSTSTGNYNSFFGKNAGYFNTTGHRNSFFGQLAGYFNTTGTYNSFFGKGTGYSNNTGTENCYFGYGAGFSGTSASDNSFFGTNAGYSNTTADWNSFFGTSAGYRNTTGNQNSFFGGDAGSRNTTGHDNSFVGQFSGSLNTTGSWNSFFGKQAGYSNTTGDYNSFFGPYAGSNNTSGTQRTAVGNSANGVGAAYNNNTGLGYGTNCTASNQVRIGNSSVTSIGGYANWTNISDSRFKKNVQEDVKGLGFIMALRPVSYNLDLYAVENFIADHYNERPTEVLPGQYDKENIRQSGFIAQEVETAAKALGYDFSGVDAPKNDDDFYGLRYAEFVVPLVKAVQEQQEMIELLVAALNENGIEVDITLRGKDKGKSVLEPKKSESDKTKNAPATSDLEALPAQYGVSQNYPNPFNPSTTIEYALPAPGQVTIKVYNNLGQEVRTLVDGFQEAGYKSVVWDGKNQTGSPVASGTYVYRVTSGNSVKSEKMIMAK